MTLRPGRVGRLALAQTGLLASSLLAAGCGLLAGGPATGPAPAVFRLGPAGLPQPLVALPGGAATSGSRTVTVQLAFAGGARRLLDVDTAFGADDVDHVLVELREGNSGTGAVLATIDLPAARLGDPISFGRLEADTEYCVVPVAFKAPGTAADDLISDGDAQEPAVIGASHDDATQAIEIEVILRDRPERVVTTWAGLQNGAIANNVGTAARFNAPFRGAFMGNGDLLIADRSNDAIRRITPGRAVSNFSIAGPLSNPADVAVNGADVILADAGNHKIRLYDAFGTMYRTYGTGENFYRNGSGLNGIVGLGPAFKNPCGVAANGTTIFVADTDNHVIRQIDRSTHQVSLLAGEVSLGIGQGGSADGPALQARFLGPRGLSLGPDGALYVADTDNARIRRIDLTKPGHPVTTVAGTSPGYQDGYGLGAEFNAPQDLDVDARGMIWVADTGNQVIRRVSKDGRVRTWAGIDGIANLFDGQGPTASFNQPVGVIAGADGTLYVSDSLNGRIRRIQ